MEDFDSKAHWENIYTNKALTEVSWYQPTPQTSLSLFQKQNVAKDAKIIDVGGGDSFLVDRLLDLGYENITILDISENAIKRAKWRLGDRANQVNWIVSDASEFNPEVTYDVWHDRAAFHFLTEESQINNYLSAVAKGVHLGGKLFVGTFSTNGPLKCSGITIQQYSEDTLGQRFSEHFKLLESFYVDHPTPFDTTQNFVFGSFERN